MWRTLVLACLLVLGGGLAAGQAQQPQGVAEGSGQPDPAESAHAVASPSAPPTSQLPPREAVPDAPVAPLPGREDSAMAQSYALPPPPPPPPEPGYGPLEMEDDGSGVAWNPWDHPEQGGARIHDGFALRLSFGLGGGRLSGQDDPLDGRRVGFSGLTVGGSLSVGGTVFENVILHGDYFFATVIDAQAQGGVYDGIGDDVNFDYEGQVGMHALGAGLTYYFMPFNAYVSGAIGLATAVWERGDGERATSKAGIAGQLLVGKEWWVESQWGLGLAVQGMMFTAPDGYYGNARGGALNLLFSATYN